MPLHILFIFDWVACLSTVDTHGVCFVIFFSVLGVTSHTFCMLGTHSISKLLDSSSPSSSHLVVLWVQVGHCEDGTGYRLGQQGQWLWASRLKVMWHLLLGSTAVTCVLFG